jgi:hypothetical protein
VILPPIIIKSPLKLTTAPTFPGFLGQCLLRPARRRALSGVIRSA